MAKIYLSALTARIMDMAQRDEVDLLELLSQIAEWTKLSDIDYEIATPENLCRVIENFTALCSLGNRGNAYKEIVKAILCSSSIPARRRVL